MTFSPPKNVLELLVGHIPPLAISSEVVSTAGPDLLPVKSSLVGADVVVSLPPRDLELLTAAPLVLGRDGVTWFEIGSDGLEISAAGDAVAFTHRSKATI